MVMAGDIFAAGKKTIIDGTFQLRSRHEILDAQIRARMASDKIFAAQMKILGRVSAQMIVNGTSMAFQAYNFATGGYDSRMATLRAIGTNCYIFVADDSYSLLGSSPEGTIAQIKSTFDEKIHPTDTSWFGTVTVPPNFGLPDEKIYILLLDIRDGIGGGYVAGYFDSRDLEGDLGNKKPIFYMDLNPGKPGDPNDKSNDFYRTLAHEFQHMINFSKHYPSTGRMQEDRWVEEGLSGFAEYVYTAKVGNDGIGLAPSPHLSRFLENPNLVLTQNSDTEWFSEATLFRHYGASFLFYYYLQEKLGGDSESSRMAFVRSLVDNPSIGINGLNSVLSTHGTNFIEVLKNWLIANHLNDTSLNNGLWGYVDKATRLGKEAAGLPIGGGNHTFSGTGLSFIGGEGRILPNAGKYEDINGTGNLNFTFKGNSTGFTPFIGSVDFGNVASVKNILLDGANMGSVTLDLSNLRKVVFVPLVGTTAENISDTFYYSFSGSSSKLVIYPVPNPAFSNEFIIVIKSMSGSIAVDPVVSVSFNNIQATPAVSATDDTRTVFVANYAIPGSGDGLVSVSIGGESSSFAFYASVLKANVPSKLKLKDVELSISTRAETENVYLYESSQIELPEELQIVSKPYFVSFNGQNTVEARLLFENQASGIERPTQVGLWSNKNASSASWLKVSQNERGFFSPISKEGLYVLVADKVSPRVNDMHLENSEEKPVLVARVSDGGAGINFETIRVEADGQSLPFSFDEFNGAISADLSRLPKGPHRFDIELLDKAENRGRGILSQVLSGPLSVVQVAAYPNPSRGAVNLAVILDGNGSNDPSLDVEARIFDVSGQKVITLPLSYKANKTYLIRWNQRNEDDKQVSNGLYHFKIIVRKGEEELKANGKLAILN